MALFASSRRRPGQARRFPPLARSVSLRVPPWLVVLLALTACQPEPPQALGTLEYDRITLPAPASERIIAIHVHEGERVRAGQPLLRLEPDRAQAAVEAAQAEAERQRQALAELEAGPRREAIAQARAQLAAAQAQARDAQAYYARVRLLGEGRLVAAAEVDRAHAAAAGAQAQVQAAQQALLELERGTRAERLAQGRAAVAAAQAQARAQRTTRGKLDVLAPRAGVVDSLPYEPGDQPPAGAPLAVLLVGEAPHARVYVPEPIRVQVRAGQAVRVFVHGREAAFAGRVRMIRSEPVFTPYYALIGKDAARLSWLAEIALTDPAARGLPAGLPVRVEFRR